MNPISRDASSQLMVGIGTRSRANRRRLSDSDIRWSASDRRWFPARPAQHVQRRRNNGKGRIKSALASARGRNDKRRRRDMQRLQRRTRRSASTIGGAARDTIIGRADADRVGARPLSVRNVLKDAPDSRESAPLPRFSRPGKRGAGETVASHGAF